MPTACSGKEQDRQMRTLQRALEEKQNELSDLQSLIASAAILAFVGVLVTGDNGIVETLA